MYFLMFSKGDWPLWFPWRPVWCRSVIIMENHHCTWDRCLVPASGEECCYWLFLLKIVCSFSTTSHRTVCFSVRCALRINGFNCLCCISCRSCASPRKKSGDRLPWWRSTKTNWRSLKAGGTPVSRRLQQNTLTSSHWFLSKTVSGICDNFLF